MRRISLCLVCLPLAVTGFAGLSACVGHEVYVSSASDNGQTRPMTADEARRVLDQLARLNSYIFYLDDGKRRIANAYITAVCTTFSAINI